MNSGGRGPLRGILGLSLGTTIVRGLSAISQILLAIWLSPEQFGFWAAASSSVALIAGLTNAGEVNGYLSGKSRSLRQTKRSTFRINSALMLCALGIAAVFFATSSPFVALLAAVAAVTIPLSGAADVSNAAAVKSGKYKYLILVQLIAALLRLGVGVLLAATTQSAIALASAALIYFVAIEAGLFRLVKHRILTELPPSDEVRMRMRLGWAANSLALTLPLQVGFFVAQFIASPAMLGIFFLAYQITVGVAGFVAGPLGRVTLAELGQTRQPKRLRLAVSLSAIFSGGMLVFVVLALWLAPHIQPLLPPQWQLAVPTTIILLASLPARMMGPVVDAYQQAVGKWWQGTAFNVVDAVGTAAAALTAVTGDVLLLAAAMAGWKIAFALFRAAIVFRASGLKRLAVLLGPMSAACGAALLAPIYPDLRTQLLVGVSSLTAIWLGAQLIQLRIQRREDDV